MQDKLTRVLEQQQPSKQQQYGYLGPVVNRETVPAECRTAVTTSKVETAAENWAADRHKPNNVMRGRKCFNCGSEDHLKRDCHLLTREPSDGRGRGSQVHEIRMAPLGDHAFVKTIVRKGNKETCISMLLDSGANTNILAQKYAHLCKSHVRPTKTCVTSATGEQVCILGEADLHFQIAGIKFCERFLISDDVSDCILSLKFLQNHAITWNFAQNTIVIQNREIPLQKVTQKSRVRKIFAVEKTVIPAGSEMCMPVKALFTRAADIKACWLADVGVVQNTVVTARTLMSNSILTALIVCNLTMRDFTINKNMLLSLATCNKDAFNDAQGTHTRTRTQTHEVNAIYAYYENRNDYGERDERCVNDVKGMGSNEKKRPIDTGLPTIVNGINQLADPSRMKHKK